MYVASNNKCACMHACTYSYIRGVRSYLALIRQIQYSLSVTSRVLASNSKGAREFRASDSREPCVGFVS